MKIVVEGTVTGGTREDGGQAMICELDDISDTTTDGKFFVRLQSWAEDAEHTTLPLLVGRRVRVTVETLPIRGEGG